MKLLKKLYLNLLIWNLERKANNLEDLLDYMDEQYPVMERELIAIYNEMDIKEEQQNGK